MKNQNHSKTILAIVVGLLAISFIFKIPVLIKIGFGIGILSLFSAFFEEKIAWAWSKIGLALGYINGNILLSIIFFIILTPIALAMRYLAGKDNLVLKKPKQSVFTIRNHQYEAKDLENVW
ncbi:MAG: SxtJ family membrane protein [Bacteroidota bacterium]